MANKPTLTKDRTKIAVSNMPGDWDTCSDPTSSREMESLRTAADKPKMQTGSNDLAYDNVTITRFWDEDRDAALLKQWRANPSYFDDGTLSLTNLGKDRLPAGNPDVYTFSVQSMSKTGSDANASTEKSKLTAVLAISGS